MKLSRGAKTIVYPTPVFVVGTYDEAGKANAMTVAWGGICCSRPPCVAISVRKATYTYSNLMLRKAFTVNIPARQHARQADYFGIISGRDVDKFAETGLTAVQSDPVDAPYIQEFPLNLLCEVLAIHEIGLHTLFVGEIKDVLADEDVYDTEGKLDVKKVDPILWAPDDGGYYSVGDFVGQAFHIGRDKE
ncbi:MAG: flavin reductase family protein [Anaerolineae bacterium]|nr:flavin reductase family protein [Anaerolineae bacterium]